MIEFNADPFWAFLIDTDQYAGSFERQMTAYCTGQFGDCERGKDDALVFLDEIGSDPFEEYIQPMPDEHGCCRPTSIWPTPGWSNDGHGHHTRLEPGQRAHAPAYQTVAIFFHSEPSEELCSIMMDRAVKFREHSEKKTLGQFGGEIEAFRLVEIRTLVEEVEKFRIQRTGNGEGGQDVAEQNVQEKAEDSKAEGSSACVQPEGVDPTANVHQPTPEAEVDPKETTGAEGQGSESPTDGV